MVTRREAGETGIETGRHEAKPADGAKGALRAGPARAKRPGTHHAWTFDRPGSLGYAPPASDRVMVQGASGPAGRESDAANTTPGLGR